MKLFLGRPKIKSNPLTLGRSVLFAPGSDVGGFALKIIKEIFGNVRAMYYICMKNY